MAEGANSAIVEATRQFEAEPGSCFVVRIPGTERIGTTHSTHVVAPNTPLVYADRATTDIKPPQGGVKVRDGDLVCIAREVGAGAPSFTPPPGNQIEPIPTDALAQVFVTTTGSTRLTTDAGSAGLAPSDNEVVRNLAYLPRGAMLLIGAPFPWDIVPYTARWPLMIEMALWYAVAALALVALGLTLRERRWTAMYLVLVGLAVGGVLSLAEGNLGTLVRHRGMLIPYAIVLATIVAERWRWLRTPIG
jgi:hypothetical protein